MIEDKFLKKKEVEIHEKLHQSHFEKKRLINDIFSSKRLQRQNDIIKAEKWNGSPISGWILDIGSGDGWCAAWIAKHRSVEQVVALECTHSAVDHLIPQTIEIVGADREKCRSLYGSFNNLESFKETFDCVTAMGALHHSENLLHTLDQCFLALKPNGILIAQEPAMENWTTNKMFLEHYKKMKEFWGIEKIREDERSDHFYRVCEWLTASYHSGFEVVKHEVSKISGEPPEGPLDLLMLLRKPGEKTDYTPHRWK